MRIVSERPRPHCPVLARAPLTVLPRAAQAERGYSDGEFDIHGSISDSSDDSSDDEESGEARQVRAGVHPSRAAAACLTVAPQRALRQRYGLDMDFEGADEEGQRAYAQMFTAGFSDLDDMEMEHGVGEVVRPASPRPVCARTSHLSARAAARL